MQGYLYHYNLAPMIDAGDRSDMSEEDETIKCPSFLESNKEEGIEKTRHMSNRSKIKHCCHRAACRKSCEDTI